ncbi:LAMI_0F07184g1_1 [Lachancea mirantina]|uniref:LAMI_0F07184g1_1 n=1 Tax=Lachancea mirantina TaxID=1230905 RepID=A0A1G4JZI1_9SACH|nr:LAMI_0F07184g1_1 [Lachancea mirantina]
MKLFIPRAGLASQLRFSSFSKMPRNTTFLSMSTRILKFPRPQLLARNALLEFSAGTSLALLFGSQLVSPPIKNDTILDVKQRNASVPEEIGLPSRVIPRRERNVNYRQLCLGSMLGLFLGIVVGKLSTILVFVTACGLLGVQWLENRGLLDKQSTIGLSKYVIKTGKESVDLNTLVWEKPSFKIPFLLTFVLAAVNI